MELTDRDVVRIRQAVQVMRRTAPLLPTGKRNTLENKCNTINSVINRASRRRTTQGRS